MKWRWLGIVVIPILLSGCALIEGISPFQQKPPCPSGPGPKGEEPCWIKMKLTKVDKNTGWVEGMIDPSVLETNKKLSEGIQLRDMTKRVFNTKKYPAFTYRWQVKGGTGNLNKGDVAVFRTEPKTFLLVHVSDVCPDKEKWFNGFLKEHGGVIDDISDAELNECPNLKNVPSKKS